MPDTGSLAGDYAALAARWSRSPRDRNAALLMPRLLAEVEPDEELHAIFYAQLVEPRRARAAHRAASGRATAASCATTPTSSSLIDMLVGPVIYRLHHHRRRPRAGGRAYAPRVLEALLRGLRPPAPGR